MDDQFRAKHPELFDQLGVAVATRHNPSPNAIATISLGLKDAPDVSSHVADVIFRRNRAIAVSILMSSSGPNVAVHTPDETRRKVTLWLNCVDVNEPDPELLTYLASSQLTKDDTKNTDFAKNIGEGLIDASGLLGYFTYLAPFAPPLLLIGLAAKYSGKIADLATSPYFMPSIYAADRLAVMHSLRERNSLVPLLDEGLREGLGIPFDSPTQYLVDTLPDGVQKQAALRIVHLVETDQHPDPSSITKDVITQLAGPLNTLKHDIVSDLEQASLQRELARLERQRMIGDIQGVISLSTIFCDKVLGDRSAARVISTIGSEALKVWQLYSGFNGFPQTVGPAALTAGYVGAALAICGALFSPDYQDPVLAGLQQVLEAISSLRVAINNRFDQLLGGQRAILIKLEDGIDHITYNQDAALKSIRELAQSVDGLQAFIEAEDRVRAFTALGGSISKIQSLKSDVNMTDYPLLDAIVKSHEHLADCVTFTCDIAAQNIFTHNDVTTSDNPARSLIQAVKSARRPDLLVGAIPSILERLRFPSDGPPPVNPIAWASGVDALLISGIAFPEMLNKTQSTSFARVRATGESCRSLLASALTPAVLKAAQARLATSIGNLTPLLDNYYAQCLNPDVKIIYAGFIPNLDGRILEKRPRQVTKTDAGWYHDGTIQFFDQRPYLNDDPEGGWWATGLDTYVNVIKIAEQVGVLRKIETGLPREHAEGRTKIRYRLQFLAGRWKDGVTSESHPDPRVLNLFSPVGSNYSQNRVLQESAGYEEWTVDKLGDKQEAIQVIYPTTTITRPLDEKQLFVISPANVKDFVSLLTIDVIEQHKLLQRQFMAGLEDFIDKDVHWLSTFQEDEIVFRYLLSLASWALGGDLAAASAVMRDEDLFCSTAKSVAAIAEQYFADPTAGEMVIGDSTISNFVAKLLIDTITNISSNALESVSINADTKFSVLELASAMLKGFAFHTRLLEDLKDSD